MEDEWEKLQARLAASKAPNSAGSDATASTEVACKPDPSGSQSPLTKEEARILIGALPLEPHSVNLSNIGRFLDLSQKVFEDHKATSKCEVVRTAEYARKLIAQTKLLTSRGQLIFAMNDDPISFASILKPPGSDKYRSLLNLLENIVTATKEITELLNSDWGDSLPSNDKARLEAQFQGSYSYAVRNIDTLRSLDSRYKEAFEIMP
jgi:hypothetical protein